MKDLIWSDKPPTREGYYWQRRMWTVDVAWRVRIVRVSLDEYGMLRHDSPALEIHAPLELEWSGPIEEPKERPVVT